MSKCKLCGQDHEKGECVPLSRKSEILVSVMCIIIFGIFFYVLLC